MQTAAGLHQLRAEPRNLVKQLRNIGPGSWDPLISPDFLLLEIEGRIRIRQVQVDIATTMSNPPTRQNAVMQLNMGEGKSSVIVPMAASQIADGKRLVRVIVAKPQFPQMMEILVSRLGGMMNRRIYQLPFCRSTDLTSENVEMLRSFCHTCISQGGVLLVQPEHLLSFQLMTIEKPIQQQEEVSRQLFQMNRLFESKARDIVEESDENFSTRFELMYTIGDQRSIEHAPDRWILIQHVLGLVFRQALKSKEVLRKHLEVDAQHGPWVPVVRFLDVTASEAILSTVVKEVCEKGIPCFRAAFQVQNLRVAMLDYIKSSRPSSEVIKCVESSSFWGSHRNTVLTLRGLFAYGLLAFVFGQKRWRVNYGLDLGRRPSTKLCVPFGAKDCPSPRSEFSHPDVVISLTCLSYYYGGLSDEYQILALQHLLRSDQPDVEFQQWVATSQHLPEAFRHLRGINLQDRDQCKVEIFPCFRYSKAAIDYFLRYIVFPKEMKEFPTKLSASGWDIGHLKSQTLTGFSGTNDSRHVLPTSVEQLELPAQKHTNALVLQHLLQAQNTVLCLGAEGLTGVCQSRGFIALIANLSPETRVILDVGALILDLLNDQVAQLWLSVTQDPKVEAAIFCNTNHDLCVMNRSGMVEKLSTSPFAAQLDQCLVFLDEAHTRGIDLQMPTEYRAAVTLGANLTKDRLIQACMRMRKLADGQSVVFCVPEEIETKMRDVTGKLLSEPLTVCDVLQWAVQATWTDFKRSMPLWLNQGRRFAEQKPLWDKAMAENTLSEATATKSLEEDVQTLEQRYRPKKDTDILGDVSLADTEILDKVRQRCHAYGKHALNSAVLQEEQERELDPEIEQERELERPDKASAARHTLHQDVIHFAETGEIVRSRGNDAFQPAFRTFDDTSASDYLHVDDFPSGLLVTKDFAKTIVHKANTDICLDDYQRTVQWILTDRQADHRMTVMVVVSPYEAQNLMKTVEKSTRAVLHLFAPREKQGFGSLDDLTLFSVPPCPYRRVPPRLRAQLALFSGELYFASYEHYKQVCNYLCLSHTVASDSSKVDAHGFIDPESHPASRRRRDIFWASPVLFMKQVMTSVRRQCETIEKTHMGKVLNGGLLEAKDFEEEGVEEGM